MIGMCKCNSVINISQFEKCSLALMYTRRHNNIGPEYSSICNGNIEYVSILNQTPRTTCISQEVSIS